MKITVSIGKTTKSVTVSAKQAKDDTYVRQLVGLIAKQSARSHKRNKNK